jgi:hypothetical protein
LVAGCVELIASCTCGREVGYKDGFVGERVCSSSVDEESTGLFSKRTQAPCVVRCACGTEENSELQGRHESLPAYEPPESVLSVWCLRTTSALDRACTRTAAHARVFLHTPVCSAVLPSEYILRHHISFVPPPPPHPPDRSPVVPSHPSARHVTPLNPYEPRPGPVQTLRAGAYPSQ